MLTLNLAIADNDFCTVTTRSDLLFSQDVSTAGSSMNNLTQISALVNLGFGVGVEVRLSGSGFCKQRNNLGEPSKASEVSKPHLCSVFQFHAITIGRLELPIKWIW